MGLISLAVAQGTEVVIGAEEKMKKRLWKSLLILLQQVLRRINSKNKLIK